MSLLDYIRKLLKKENVKMLNKAPAEEELDNQDTITFVAIDTIESIIKDNEMYKKFKKFDKNFFDDRIPLEEYKNAIEEYVNFMLERNVPFTPKELKRIEKITGKKYSKKQGKERKVHKDVKTLVGEMIREPSLMEGFKRSLEAGKDFEIDGIDQETIKKELIKVCSELPNVSYDKLFDLVRSIQAKERQKNMQNKDNNPSNEEQTLIRRKVDKDKKINSEFKKLVLSKLPQGIENFEDKEEVAFCIYTALNQCLVYDSTYFALGANMSNENVSRLMQIDISDITPENNNVICKSWAEYYSYFLGLFGIESSVVSKPVQKKGKIVEGQHRYVEIKLGNEVIYADATNAKQSDYDGSYLSDITRAKIGTIPAGFESKRFKEYSDKYNIQMFRDSISELFDMMEANEEKEVEETEQYGKRDKLIMEATRKVALISEQLQKANLDNLSTVQYLRMLYWLLLEEEKKNGIVDLKDSLYTINDKGRGFMKTSISINIGTEEEPDYRYAILNEQETGLDIMDAKMLQERIESR